MGWYCSQGALPAAPSGASLTEEGTVPPMQPGAFVKDEGVVPPMPPDAFVKVGVVVKEEEGSDSRPKRQRAMCLGTTLSVASHAPAMQPSRMQCLCTPSSSQSGGNKRLEAGKRGINGLEMKHRYRARNESRTPLKRATIKRASQL